MEVKDMWKSGEERPKDSVNKTNVIIEEKILFLDRYSSRLKEIWTSLDKIVQILKVGQLNSLVRVVLMLVALTERHLRTFVMKLNLKICRC